MNEDETNAHNGDQTSDDRLAAIATAAAASQTPTPGVVTSAWDTSEIPAAPPASTSSWEVPSPPPPVRHTPHSSFNEEQPTLAPLPPEPIHIFGNNQPTVLPPASSFPADPDGIRPVPVVRVLSPIGVEYVFMTFALFSGAIGLASALLSLVNGKADFSVLAFPTASLVVSLPVFAYFFLRLKKLELLRPELKLDPSKRRSTQFTQIVSFATCLFTLIGLVFAIFAKLGGQSPISIGKAILDALCVLAVAGGILAYYWRNEHKA